MLEKVIRKTVDIFASFGTIILIFTFVILLRFYFVSRLNLLDDARMLFDWKFAEGVFYPVYDLNRFILNKAEEIVIAQKNMADDNNDHSLVNEANTILLYVDEIISSRYPQLDSGLVKAIIYHESRFIPSSVNSKSGTTGLMQISPKWHTDRAKKLGVEDLKDPYGNILVGCDFLNELMERYPYEYAINVYAGGYKYANRFKKKQSPIVKEFLSIKKQIEQGEIIPGGG